VDSAHLWSQSIARRSMMGHERTNNPTPAAAAMLGKKRVAKAVKIAKSKGRKRRHRGNPSAAEVGSLVPIPGAGVVGSIIGSIFGGAHPKDKQRFAIADGLAHRAALGDKQALNDLMEYAGKGKGTGFATQKAKDYALTKLAELNSGTHVTTQLQQLAGIANSPVGLTLTKTLAQGLTRRGRSTGRRSLVGYDEYGGPIYRRARQPRAPRAPGVSRAGLGLSSALGKGALVAAAGTAAYLGSRAVLSALGNRALNKEEAGVAATLALRQARTQLAAQLHRQPTAAELRQMSAGWKQQLIQLGYNPVTFTRTRSGVENFLTDYSSQEE